VRTRRRRFPTILGVAILILTIPTPIFFASATHNASVTAEVVAVALGAVCGAFAASVVDAAGGSPARPTVTSPIASMIVRMHHPLIDGRPTEYASALSLKIYY
jgi:hypothetical protein